METIIISLDGMSHIEACTLALKAKGKVWGFKVNDLLLSSGVRIIHDLKQYGKVMADSKLFDIPSTMDRSVDVLLDAGADIITVHCAANYRPKRSPINIARKLAGVFSLTSSTENGSSIYNCGYKYMVCPVPDLIHMDYSSLIICPGIRPMDYNIKDDQVKVGTATEAILGGADLLVVGRPITRASDPGKVLNALNREIEEAHASVP